MLFWSPFRIGLAMAFTQVTRNLCIFSLRSQHNVASACLQNIHHQITYCQLKARSLATKQPSINRGSNTEPSESNFKRDLQTSSLESRCSPVSTFDSDTSCKLQNGIVLTTTETQSIHRSSSLLNSSRRTLLTSRPYSSDVHIPTRNAQSNRYANKKAARRSWHPLLTRHDIFQTSRHSAHTFSPTKAILQASPTSVQPYLHLIRFDKPIGSWLLYWPCTWSIALAANPGCMPDLRLLAIFGAGAFFMRGSGCIINDMWDKDFDAKVERTKLRPLAAGDVTYFQALVFLGTQLSCALALLLQLNNYSIILGVASMGLVILYPLAKRFTYWPQLMLGFTFNYGALLGWAAVKESVDWTVCLPLYMSCILWTIVYDTIYAHQDKYDDMLIGVKSTAIALGSNTKPVLTAFAVAMAGGLTTSGVLCDMTWPYYTAVAFTATRLLQQIYSTDLENAEACADAFKGNFYLGAMMFVGIIMANYLKEKSDKENANS